ncbi:rRNA cytosine-C5-methyltransferase [Bacteroidia bacterium]|nr:rRNA cytosine-C5-methyltransferase [Bacteroidia bacterium]
MELPADFIFRTRALLGDDWGAFEQALSEEIPTSIRLNPAKPLPEACLTSLAPAEKVAWASDAYYLNARPVFTLDPLFHAGCYYVQEASSMYLETVMKKQVSEKVKALDLCAAPGGKSTQLISTLPAGSLLVANEVIRSRAHILAENLTKWGNPHTIVTNNDPADFGKIPGFFDVLLTDVPCSGEGMFRKDPNAVQEWSVRNVQLCAERQRRILADSWPALKAGGILIYSTCTYNREENEDNLQWICEELGAEIIEQPRRFLPHRTKGEGFFIAVLQKNETENSTENNRTKKRQPTNKQTVKIPQEIKQLLVNADDFSFFADKNVFSAFPSTLEPDYLFLKDRFKILSAGVRLGEWKGKDFIPDHALAMSVALSPGAFPKWELDKPAALLYLRKETIPPLPSEFSKSYVLVTYRNIPLGFIKNIGNRSNNLYPQEWRIRMAIS